MNYPIYYFLLLTSLSLLACSNRNSKTDELDVENFVSPSVSAVRRRLLPTPNIQPITPGSFCLGLSQMKMKQDLSEEAEVLCSGVNPTPFFNRLLENPTDSNQVQLIPVPQSNRIPVPNSQVQNYVAYSMRIPKKVVPALLGDEQIIRITNYSNGQDFMVRLEVSNDPPPNDGDSDTAFRIVQYSISTNSRVRFNDRSVHDLKLYRMFTNNYDFLVSGRTLVQPSDQVKRASILRGFMTDPDDRNSTISFTVVNSIMNGRGYNDEVGARFRNFVLWDVRNSFNFHQRN